MCGQSRLARGGLNWGRRVGESFFKRTEPRNLVSAFFRSSCTVCGSSQPAWMTPEELMERVPARDRESAQVGIDLVGDRADGWGCTKCGEFGIL